MQKNLLSLSLKNNSECLRCSLPIGRSPLAQLLRLSPVRTLVPFKALSVYPNSTTQERELKRMKLGAVALANVGKTSTEKAWHGDSG